MIERFPKFLILSLTLIALVLVPLILDKQAVQAQTIFSSDDDGDGKEIPENLTPALIDRLLAGLSDEELRELFRDELVRQADEKVADEVFDGTVLAAIETRLSEMAERIETRVIRWSGALANLGSRGPKVQERLALAKGGLFGMILSGGLLIGVGFLAAWLINRSTRKWQNWLTKITRCGYWEKVYRTIALGVLEVLPILGFVAATRICALAPPMESALGPLNAMVWIYYAGVGYSWLFIVISRRAFAPDTPQIRIAPLQDKAAEGTHQLLQRAVCIGATGWLFAGFFPTLGLGFPPALITVALAGTTVAGLLLFALFQNFERIQEISALVLDDRALDDRRQVDLNLDDLNQDYLNQDYLNQDGEDLEDDNIEGSENEASENKLLETVNEVTPFVRIISNAAPLLLGGYVLFAWLYWLAHWLERGQHHLEGPVGTLIVFFSLPIFDRLGREIVRSLLHSYSEMAERFRGVFNGAWRVFISIIGFLVVTSLWGLDLMSFAKGEDAPIWASTGFDILITLLCGILIWNMIGAALHLEKRVSGASEDVDPMDMPAASRLDTLTPLFRNTLLGFLGIIVIMTVLSSVGVDIAPLIASAGVVGIAVGFGAQTLVKDIFSGIFFLVDDAFRIGEYIELDKQTRGEVESISIRSLQLRHHRGSVITVPFGELKKITNHNRDWVIYKMPFRLEPDTDPKHVKKVVKLVGKEFLKHPEHGPKFLEPLKSQGILSIDDDSALIMRVKFKCKPRAQFVLRREIYHKLRSVFADEGIEFARRKVEVVGPDGEKVDSAAAGAVPPEQLADASATPKR
ncbi:MAG: mechanosensitive ion channel family protein [Halopseudomonas aestusnigri]